MSIDRRHFLRTSAGLGGVLLPSGLVAATPNRTASGAKSDAPQLRVLLNEADGSPLDAKRAATLIARDLPNDPLPQKIVRAAGRARIDLAGEPLQVAVRLNVPGFGEVYCWADNGGMGYSRPANVEFVVHAAATRLRRVREIEKAARGEGLAIDANTLALLNEAGQPVNDVRTAYTSLAAGLHAGEQLTLARARHRIARFAEPRKDFLFGCMVSGFDRLGPKYEELVRERFNFATASWYTWGKEQPVEGRINYARMDGSLDWCWARNITPKGFGYCYMTRGATPEWLRAWPFNRILPEYERVVAETMRRYAGRLKYAEIINEAHDKANLWRLSHAQVIEITRAVCAAARKGSPTVRRLINHCCLWAEYADKPNDDGSRRWSPYRYLADCVAGGVEFEAIGLQLYYPQMDLLEIERMLDRFRAFNKPLHITEIATASAEGLDPHSMRPNTAAPRWHGRWSEETQADWLEAIYTLVYSKPEFEAIGWWDLTDSDGHFWPHGGLAHADLTPKLAYHRLGELQQKWGIAWKK
ncbi:MAG: endo-1,4-beta-xylanase [Pirellulales bacterium]